MPLENKTALVTGASRGIGRATATALAESGAFVLVHYGHSAADAESLVNAIRAKEGRAEGVQADLGTPNGPVSLAHEVRSITGDRLDVFISNAGISKSAIIKDHTVGLRQSLCGERAESLLPGAAIATRTRVWIKHHFDFLCGGAQRGGQSHPRWPFDPCLCGDQRRHRNACQE